MAKNRLTVLGSGTCVPSLERSSSSLFIEGDEEKILLDIGPGTMHRLVSCGVSIDEIDAVLLSHFHPDHAGELAPFLFSTKYPAPMRRNRPLTIVGGEGVRRFLEALNEAFDGVLDLPPELIRIVELSENGSSGEILGEYELAWGLVRHRPESRAYRLIDSRGASLVCSGDTDYSEELIALASGADLFVCEAAFPDEHKVEGHLTPSLAGEIASKTGVERLVLTHFYPVSEGYDIESQCRRSYGGKLDLAHDLFYVNF